MTLTNLIVAAGMEGSGWSGSYSTVYAMDGTKSLVLTGTGTTPEVVAQTTATIPLDPAHIYYARVYGWQDTRTEATVGFYWPIAEPSFREGIPIGAAGQWVMYSGRSGRGEFAAGSYPFRLDYNNSNIAGTMYFDCAMLIDLTAAYGAGAEPSREWCDANIPYFAGSYVTSNYEAGDVLDFAYSGGAQTLTLKPGVYKLEAWGAQGGYRSGASYGGKGGYASGTLTLDKPTPVYIHTGGAGNSRSASGSSGTLTPGGYNGGGARYRYCGGGGASDVRLGTDSLYARVLVAGGGGSDGAANKAGGYGGGENGESRTDNYGTGGGGATQIAGGTGSSNNSGVIGVGGTGLYRSSGYGGAGGGGWFGGGGAYPDSSGDDDRGGGGGSGFVWTGVNAPAGYLLGVIYYLTDTSLLAGNVAITDPDGNAVTGHSGNGYVRITVIECGVSTPENLRQTAKTVTSITLAWDAPTQADSYNVYRDGELIVSGMTTASYTDTGLLPDHSYAYFVVTVYDNKTSDPSTTLTATTEFAWYIDGPVIRSAAAMPNPAAINVTVTLTVTVTDELVILEPVCYYAGEIYAGEDT